MTALKTTQAQRDSLGGVAVNQLADLIHDAELAATLEETVGKLSIMLNEAHNENKALTLLLREIIACSFSSLGATRMSDVRERAIDLLERKHAEGTKP